jgi:hypothetical protein
MVATPPAFSITKMAVRVTANAQTKRYRASDPPLTYVSVPAVGSVLANGQAVSFTGSLTRATGESVGTYPIRIGTLNNTNYTITFVGANLTITYRFFGRAINSLSTIPAVSDTTIGNGLIQSEAPIGNEVIVNEPTLNVYPNPFTDHLYFELQLPTDGNVILEVYDISGVKRARIFSDDVKANSKYQIEYTPGNVSSGILIYRLYINGKIYFTGKAIHK